MQGPFSCSAIVRKHLIVEAYGSLREPMAPLKEGARQLLRADGRLSACLLELTVRHL